MPSVPFRQLRFEDVPEVPTVPHRWAEATRRDVTIEHEGLPPTRIAVREYGSGPPLVLVHGLMTAGYSFRYVLDLLGAKHRLVIPDLRRACDRQLARRLPLHARGDDRSRRDEPARQPAQPRRADGADPRPVLGAAH